MLKEMVSVNILAELSLRRLGAGYLPSLLGKGRITAPLLSQSYNELEQPCWGPDLNLMVAFFSQPPPISAPALRP